MSSLPPSRNRSLALPPALELAVRAASVPAHVRGLFARLPERITLRVEVPSDADRFVLSMRQLLKIATASPNVELDTIHIGKRGRVELASSGKTFVCDGEGLERDLADIARDAFVALFSPLVLHATLESFAAQSARLEALHTLTTHMLEATDLDGALSVMLSGITSGHGLGMNRAALFLYDEARDVYVGKKAIGPHDAEEAHRIWEAIEVEEKTIANLVEDHVLANTDGRFQAFVETLELARTPHPNDEVTIAEGASTPKRFRSERAQNASLGSLGVTGEFVVHVVRIREAVLGLLVCDNVYNQTPIVEDQLEALASFIAQAALVWQNLSLLERVEALARHDGLTGLLNRRALEAGLDEERARALRTERPLSVLVLDLDDFKLVNDRHGHAAGDAALRAVAELLRTSLRAGDHAGRFGGDEFLVVLPETGEGEAAVVARRIGEAAARAGVQLSVGGATWPTGIGSLDELLGAADENLYQAKRGGRARGQLANGVAIGPFV